jgi:hypothetical protein
MHGGESSNPPTVITFCLSVIIPYLIACKKLPFYSFSNSLKRRLQISGKSHCLLTEDGRDQTTIMRRGTLVTLSEDGDVNGDYVVMGIYNNTTTVVSRGPG